MCQPTLLKPKMLSMIVTYSLCVMLWIRWAARCSGVSSSHRTHLFKFVIKHCAFNIIAPGWSTTFIYLYICIYIYIYIYIYIHVCVPTVIIFWNKLKQFKASYGQNLFWKPPSYKMVDMKVGEGKYKVFKKNVISCRHIYILITKVVI